MASDKYNAPLDAIFESLNRSDAPGLVVGVAKAGSTVYRRGFGLASIEHGVANTPSTRMRIGSTSKHFTCLAALLLAEEGKLEIDAPANTILPELPPLRGIPTLRQFMSHTSGYRCEIDLWELGSGMAMQPQGEALAAQLRQTDVNFAPGDGQLYCNGGYHLLSLAIERASGLPFEQFLFERIFEPLGMTDTQSIPSDMAITPGIATMHLPTPDGRWRRGIFPTDSLRGEGAMVSTVDDMLTWLAHFRGPKRVGSEASWSQLIETAQLNNGLRTTYALGLMRHLYRGVEVIHHAGGVIGGQCQMLTVPEHALDIVLMTNGAPASPVALAYKIVDAILGDEALGAAPVMAGIEGFRHLIGTRYHGEKSGMTFGFGEVSDKLGVSVFNTPPAPVLRDEGEVLRVGFEDVALGELIWRRADLAARSDGAAPPTIDFSESGTVERFHRLSDTPPPTKEAGLALVGRYRSPDLDAEAKIEFEGEALSLTLRTTYAGRKVQLEALSDDVFGGAGEISLFFVLTLSHGARGVDGFRLSTGRTRGLWFGRIAEPTPAQELVE